MTQSFFDHPDLSGHHEPVRFEAIAPDLIATMHIPFRVPAGFHCNYYSADNPLYQQAMPTSRADA